MHNPNCFGINSENVQGCNCKLIFEKLKGDIGCNGSILDFHSKGISSNLIYRSNLIK